MNAALHVTWLICTENRVFPQIQASQNVVKKNTTTARAPKMIYRIRLSSMMDVYRQILLPPQGENQCRPRYYNDFRVWRAQILSHLNRGRRGQSPSNNSAVCASPTYSASRSAAIDGGKHPMENGTNACDTCEKSDFRNELDLIAHKRAHMHQSKPTNLSTKVRFPPALNRPTSRSELRVSSVDIFLFFNSCAYLCIGELALRVL